MVKSNILDTTFLSFEGKKMRSPQEIIASIAYSLKEGKKGEEYTVAELSRKTEMHYMTVNNYLNMIEYVQKNIPLIDKVDLKGQTKIIIMEELKTGLSESERMLLFMFDKRAYTKESALLSKSFRDEDRFLLISGGLVVEKKSKLFLTTEGIIEAAKYADKRAEKVVANVTKYVISCAIETTTDWTMETNKLYPSSRNMYEDSHGFLQTSAVVQSA